MCKDINDINRNFKATVDKKPIGIDFIKNFVNDKANGKINKNNYVEKYKENISKNKKKLSEKKGKNINIMKEFIDKLDESLFGPDKFDIVNLDVTPKSDDGLKKDNLDASINEEDFDTPPATPRDMPPLETEEEAAKRMKKVYDQDGYDKFGFNEEGFAKDGYDKFGFNEKGFAKDGYDKFGFNGNGFDHRENNIKNLKFNNDKYNEYGYDRDGCNRWGFNRKGYDRDGFNKDGFNRNGFNRDGFNEKGFNREGEKKLSGKGLKILTSQ